MARITNPLLVAVVVLPLMSVRAGEGPAAAPLFGFTPETEQVQRALESKFDGLLNPDDLRNWLERMSSAPNHVGAPHNKENAEFTLAKLKEWGWDAHIETFQVLYPTPKTALIEMIAPSQHAVTLAESAVPGDQTSTQIADELPPYTAYAADGDVTADIVYVNYGMPEDYKTLARYGISVKDKIVLARYGGGWRGLKPKLAQEHGAVGCIIYSDPADDGYATEDAYPKGGARPPQGVQRGSVMDMPVRAGDPLTPNIGATKEAKRLPRDKAETILKIPVLPISHGDAQPLLAALTGAVVPPGWRGALPLTYHFGPGPTKVHMVLRSDWSLKPLYDVIAMLKGGDYPDQWVIRGNHRDGWVFGAWDPLSGHVAMMAEAQALGALSKGGWKPKRTLVYASWDGEEPGLLGSTEWAEAHADELGKKAALYLNSDSNARGLLEAGGSHSLQHFVNQVADDVIDPETGVSVRERLGAVYETAAFEHGGDGARAAQAEAASKGTDLAIGALGSGSDFSPYLQHLGIAAIDTAFGGEDIDGGIYHSAYDSFDHYIRFGDPTFAYGVVLAKTIGRLAMRAADADVLPHRFGDFADTIGQYVAELHRLTDDKRKHAETLERLLKKNAFKLAGDPQRPVAPPAAESAVPRLEMARLDNAVDKLKKSAEAYDTAYAAKGNLSKQQLAALNALLTTIDRTQLDARGLPGRPWYKNLIYAPGLYTGYGAKTLPGVREAIEEDRWDEGNAFAVMTAAAIETYAAGLDKATALIKTP